MSDGGHRMDDLNALGQRQTLHAHLRRLHVHLVVRVGVVGVRVGVRMGVAEGGGGVGGDAAGGLVVVVVVSDGLGVKKACMS